MQAIKATGSKIETILAKALFAKGYRYRKNNKTVFGKPDFTFKKLKIAIFVDGEFWHGKDWNNKKQKIKSNLNYWPAKIKRNIARDKEVNAHLKEEGWNVQRFWGKEVEKNLEVCVAKIEGAIKKSRKIEK